MVDTPAFEIEFFATVNAIKITVNAIKITYNKKWLGLWMKRDSTSVVVQAFTTFTILPWRLLIKLYGSS